MSAETTIVRSDGSWPAELILEPEAGERVVLHSLHASCERSGGTRKTPHVRLIVDGLLALQVPLCVDQAPARDERAVGLGRLEPSEALVFAPGAAVKLTLSGPYSTASMVVSHSTLDERASQKPC